MAHIIGTRPQLPAVTDQVVKAMPPDVLRQFQAELQMLAADATLDLLGQLGMTRPEVRAVLKQGSLKSIRKGRRPVATKKKGNRARITCTGCDSKMKEKDVACRKCGIPRPGGLAATGSASKALFVPGDGSRPFLVKMAGAGAFAGKSATPAVTKAHSGNVVPISAAKSARTCWNGCAPGKPGYRHCPRCSQPYGLDYAGNAAWQFDRIMKAARAPKSRQDYLDDYHDDHNPATREMTWAAFIEPQGNGGRTA